MLNYLVGDLFKLMPVETKSPKFICHIVNNQFQMGSGFVVPLMQHYPEVRPAYMAQPILVLGETQFVPVKAENHGALIWVCHMCAQNSLISSTNPKPIKYAALISCMEQVAKACFAKKGEIWAPMFGSLRAGGNWSFIEELINEIWEDLPVTICKFDENEK